MIGNNYCHFWSLQDFLACLLSDSDQLDGLSMFLSHVKYMQNASYLVFEVLTLPKNNRQQGIRMLAISNMCKHQSTRHDCPQLGQKFLSGVECWLLDALFTQQHRIIV